MRLRIDQDELYPYYDFWKPQTDTGYGVIVDIEESTVARWQQVMDAFSAVQEEIASIYDANQSDA